MILPSESESLETLVKPAKSSFFSKGRNKLYALAFSLAACAGMERGCSSCGAENFGANWLVTQYDISGKAFNCWKLDNVSISNEPHSDGIYWLEPTGNLVHISGWYNRVQVEQNQWDPAAKSLGIELNKCKDGRYTP